MAARRATDLDFSGDNGYELNGPFAFLPKPFGVESLTRKIREIIEAEPKPAFTGHAQTA